MKRWNLTIALFSFLLLSSCTKENTSDDDPLVASLSNTDPLIIEWESGYTWQKSDSADYHVYSHERIMPELTSSIIEKGAVLVALKNLPYKEDSLYTHPKLAPFSLIPYYGHDQQGKESCDQHWYIIPSVGKLTIKYRTNRFNFSELPELAPDGRVEAKYFLFTDSQLKQLGYTQKTIQQLTYEALMKLPGIS